MHGSSPAFGCLAERVCDFREIPSLIDSFVDYVLLSVVNSLVHICLLDSMLPGTFYPCRYFYGFILTLDTEK